MNVFTVTHFIFLLHPPHLLTSCTSCRLQPLCPPGSYDAFLSLRNFQVPISFAQDFPWYTHTHTHTHTHKGFFAIFQILSKIGNWFLFWALILWDQIAFWDKLFLPHFYHVWLYWEVLIMDFHLLIPVDLFRDRHTAQATPNSPSSRFCWLGWIKRISSYLMTKPRYRRYGSCQESSS